MGKIDARTATLIMKDKDKSWDDFIIEGQPKMAGKLASISQPIVTAAADAIAPAVKHHQHPAQESTPSILIKKKAAMCVPLLSTMAQLNSDSSQQARNLADESFHQISRGCLVAHPPSQHPEVLSHCRHQGSLSSRPNEGDEARSSPNGSDPAEGQVANENQVPHQDHDL